MDIILMLTVIGTGIAVIGFVHTFFRNFKTDIKTDIARLDSDMKEQGKRTDHLYQMFLDLQKTFVDSQKNTDQKFYDILKESKK